MAEKSSIIQNPCKKQSYETILYQIAHLIENETDLIANLANICAVLKESFNFFWVGFYFVKKDQLVLGPFQGPLACTRIPFGKGVCGTVYTRKKTIIVNDVREFSGHISCNSESKSEIVVPFLQGDKVKFLLDIDSDKLAFFDEIDKKYLEKLMKVISKKNLQ